LKIVKIWQNYNKRTGLSFCKHLADYSFLMHLVFYLSSEDEILCLLNAVAEFDDVVKKTLYD